jgi:hypothetical protein
VAALPRGAGAGRTFAAAIVSDPTRRSGATAYWKERLEAEGETVLGTGTFSSDAMKLAARLPRVSFASLVKEFTGFFSADDETAMVSRSGCLTSLADLAAETGVREADIPSELQFLGGFDPSGKPKKAEVERLATALRLAREVYDMVRRFALCTENATTAGVARADLLAIYQQEGALGIAPPESSWRHAPVIRTSDTGCRNHRNPLWDRTTTRIGFALAHDQASPLTPSKRNETSLQFGLAIRHIVIIGGFDQVIDPRLAASDELLALYSCMRTKPPGTYPPIDALKKDILGKLSTAPSVQGSIHRRQKSIASQADIFDGLAIGLLASRIESVTKGESLPAEAELLTGLETSMRALLAAHPAKLESGRVFLAAADDSSDARLSLEHQASWYAGRKRIRTLLAWRDRDSYSGPEELHSLLAYLRFNIGEFNFVRTLIWFAHRLAELKAPRAKATFGLSEAFVNAAAAVAWTPADARTAAKLWEAWKALSNTGLGSSPGWRNVGLLDALAAQGAVCTTSAPASKTMELAADAALATVTLYAEEGLFPLLELFVLSHPIDVSVGKVNVVALRPADSRRPMRNAFSFERIRRVTAKALADASVPP